MNYFPPIIMIALGLWHYHRHGLDIIGSIPIVLGTVALYLTIFNRPALERVLTYLMKLWYPIGKLISLALFAAAFYIIFAPVGLLLRLFKKDILNKDFKTDRPSYWIDRSSKEVNNYTQQF